MMVRRLSLAEMDQAAVIHRTALDERLPWLAGRHTPAQDRSFFRDHVFADCAVWGVIDDAVIGFIAFREGWIDQLYVLPQWQGQGVGQALVQVAKAAWPRLQLWTFQRNALGRRFYAKQGFVVVMESDGSRNEEHEPDVLYRWDAGESRPDGDSEP
jgi:putative acetyltransferase